jgi:hypothetical protein
MTDAIVCAICGRSHPVSDGELTFGVPDVVFALSEDDKDARCKIGKEIVELDGARFFVRGLLPLEVFGRERDYSLGVWAEVSRDILDRIRELWSDPGQDQEPLMSAKLANKVPFHSDTVGLSLGIQLTGPTTRPRFFLDPVAHSLYIEQLCGINEHRAVEYSDPASRTAAVEQALAGDAQERAPEGRR